MRKNTKAIIKFREADIHDLAMLQEWDKEEHVIAADPDDDWNWEVELLKNPPWREQLMAELDGKPIGFVQIIDPQAEETHYWGEIAAGKRAIDIWIGKAEHLGKGYGTEMMRLAIDRCFETPGVTEILIDPLESNTRAIQFYEKLGFELVEKRKFGESACCVYLLKIEKWQQIGKPT